MELDMQQRVLQMHLVLCLELVDRVDHAFLDVCEAVDLSPSHIQNKAVSHIATRQYKLT